MQLFPAIDLRGGKVVRLTQGDYDRMTVYGEDPCAQARAFLEAGAKNLHVVDLDGAKDGTLSNYDTIAALAKQGGLYIEVGGGIRTEERIEKYLSLGVGRCILGSVAVTNFDFTARMLKKYGEKIAVGVDARDGYVAIHGWNAVHILRDDPLFKYVRDGEYFYYVHSYYGKNCAANTLAVSDYSLPVTGVVKAGKVYGTQFHPEKSGDAGLRLLKAFAEL